MSLWTRITNLLRGGNRLNVGIDEELESHLEEAIAEGRDPVEVRRAFGSPLRTRESSRGVRLDWPQLVRNKTASTPQFFLSLSPSERAHPHAV
jgi:hypothetical protein